MRDFGPSPPGSGTRSPPKSRCHWVFSTSRGSLTRRLRGGSGGRGGGTIKSRLSRARARLRSRLSRRGLTPTELLGAGALPRTRLPDALVDSTVRLARQSLAGQAGLAAIAATSATVAALTQGVIR